MNTEVLSRLWEYINTAFTGIKPTLAVILTFITTICFPEEYYVMALLAVVGASFLDIVTKYYALCKNHGGYRQAILAKKIKSKVFWQGTQVKIISYLCIVILTGLAHRVIYLQQVGIVISSFVYSVMFMREFQSSIENLVEAGADLEWLLLFSRKKNKDLMEPYEEDEEDEKEEDDDYEERV